MIIVLLATAPGALAYAQLLEILQQQSRPVYLEIDPRSSVIARLLIPLVERVTTLEVRTRLAWTIANARNARPQRRDRRRGS